MSELFQHQRRALEFMKGKPGVLITAGLGTGKTRIVLEEAKALRRPLLVVCPKSVIPVWLSEQKKWDKEGLIPKLTVINYERVWRTPLKVSRDTILVADEAHKLKDRRTKQSRAMRLLAKQVEIRRALTATPAPNGIQDLWAIYDFVQPGLLGPWRRFAEEHLVFHPVFPSKVVAARNVAKLRSTVAGCTFHVSQEEVLQLPPETTIERTFELSGGARVVYERMERDLYAELDDSTVTAPNSMVKILRLAEITGGFVHNDDGTVSDVHRDKLNLLGDILDELGNEPVVICCRFKAEIKAVASLLRSIGKTYVILDGDTPLSLRGAVVENFQRGAVDVFLMQIQTGSLGISLTRSQYMIFYSVGFSFGDYEQARGRIRRHGQNRPQFYIHLIAENTIDEYIMHALNRKQGVHEAIQSWWRREKLEGS